MKFRWVILTMLIISLFVPGSVQADEGEVILVDTLEIKIWPEYDRPDVLVIYQIGLSENTPLQSSISVRIPIEAEAPNAVAYRGNDGGLYNLEYTMLTDGDWQIITFVAPSQVIHIEYYDPRIRIDEQKRAYEFVWPGGLIVQNLVFQVQKPLNASDFSVTPDMGEGQLGNDGLLYYGMAQQREVPADESAMITIRYEKPNDALSINLEQVEPVQPIREATSTVIEVGRILPWVFGLGGAFLILGGLLWYWQTGQQRKPVEKRKRHRSNIVKDDGEDEDETLYCHQCGKRAESGDKYCRSCGAKLRR